jgi:hypothetical protein
MWTPWKKKKKNPKTFNIYHEDFADKVEPALDNEGKHFEVDGVKYYRFKQETMMPYGRYKMLEMFIKQVDLRMTPQILSAFITKIEQNISGEKGQVNLTKVYEAIMAIKARLTLTFEIETVYSYASVVYFDDSENLYDYDKTINEKKISRWREANTIDFFYTRPMSELFGLSNTSKIDLVAYIKAINEAIGLTSETIEP